MHEQPIVDAVLGVILEVAAGRPVGHARVHVGRRLAVSRESFEQWFEMLSAGTEAAGAAIEQVAVEGDGLLVEEVRLTDGEVIRNPTLAVARDDH